ncbi:MAG: lipopolysaccharide transport periplasmic protein LptA [Candidatus Schekmanbacteria bacterium RBG_16_38_11]|uniref:Lipopolysaccharide transport periplasmic protein LptA n=1 Tax=Candidatus Schekmanbacteria bacterium RBG_16_38_11 TaxID=1817880 RepID=A0A1F7RW21_9BACT|nr:MAG: lipopolysaccharide transport periplasmic protein LptA [Candidatus Schekmanbacteria bacterium RBG_16_38_11]
MKKLRLNLFALFLVLYLFILVNITLGQDSLLDAFGKSSGRDNNIPLNITSERMEGFNQKNLVVFYGHVKAVRGDTTLWSDRMEIYFEREEKKIDRIVALGNVKVNQEDKNAVASKATYYENGQKIVLEGNPRLWQKGDVLKGDKITLFLNEDRILVEIADVQIRPKTIEKKVAKDQTK